MRFFWYGVFYSSLGFLLETAFARVTKSPKPDRKCRLLLPVCPVYGLGAVGILLLPQGIAENPLLLWLFGGGIATAVEYLLGWFYEETLGVRFWDYSHLPGNVKGRVCPRFSLIWGALAVILCRVMQSWVETWVANIPPGAFLPVFALWMTDAFLTFAVLSAHGDTAALRWYDRLRS